MTIAKSMCCVAALAFTLVVAASAEAARYGKSRGASYRPAPQARGFGSGGAYKPSSKPAWALQKTHPQKYSR